MAIKVLRLFTKSLVRIADSLETIEHLYRLDLASRGIVLLDPKMMNDPVEVAYGYQQPIED